MPRRKGKNILMRMIPSFGIAFLPESLQFPQLPDSSPDPILITNTKGNIYYVNPAWEKLTGYTANEVKGKTPQFLQSKKTPKRIYKNLWKALQEGNWFSTDEISNTRKDGSEYQTYATFFPIKKNNKNRFFVQVSFDITKQYSSKKMLQESEAKLQLIINNANGYAICMLDKYGRIVSWNLGAERLTGYTSSEVKGKHIAIFFLPDEIKRKKPQKYITYAASRNRYEASGIRVRKDGNLIWVNTVLCAIKSKKGALKGFVEITRDITKEKEVEQQKDAFIGVASHELKTPITTLSAYAQILEKRLSQKIGEKDMYFLKNIKLQTEKLTGLINDLLNVSKLESGKIMVHNKPFNINELVKKVIIDFQYSNDTHEITKEGKVEKEVYGDEARIEEVFTNLLTNAIKYSPKADKVIIHLANDKNHAYVKVQDFGSGIGKEDIPHLFKRFYRTKDKDEAKISGFGLGLYISSEIIKKHKGKMWVESEKGKGSTFSFSVPLVKS